MTDFVTEVPRDRWDPEEYYDPEPGVPGRSVSKWGAFLDDVAGFDAAFFGITEREATAIDPQHRVLLETAWEAVEHAGLNPAAVAGSQTGVFMGLTHNDYAYLAADTARPRGSVRVHRDKFQPRVGAHRLRARASRSGRHGGHGVLVRPAAPSTWPAAACTRARVISRWPAAFRCCSNRARRRAAPRRACCRRPAVAMHSTSRADGFVSAEGAVVLTLKRLDDAMADGDRILAVIRGTATNQDGRTINISTPSPKRSDLGVPGGAGGGGRGGQHRRPGRGSRHRNPRRGSARVRQRGRGVRHRRPVRTGLGQDELRAHPVSRGRAWRDEGGPGGAPRRRTAESALHPHARRDGADRDEALCASGEYGMADQRRAIRGGRRCRRTGCQARTCTRSSSRPRAEQSAHEAADTSQCRWAAAVPVVVDLAPKSCDGQRADSPTGWRIATETAADPPWTCPTWATRSRVGVATGPCGPR